MRSTENIISTKTIAALTLLFCLLTACTTSPPPLRGEGFVVPLTYKKITSYFGPRDGRPHRGVDFSADRGTRVWASAPGRVTFVGRQRGYGRIVILDHENGMESYYAHLSAFSVREGQRVAQGHPIGKVGASGNATGPHLHFEIRQDGVAIDPMRFLPL
ncbi:MAG: peptidoglycan DD-metalloendopeptidase family protein [Pseudomonadota bacterium]